MTKDVTFIFELLSHEFDGDVLKWEVSFMLHNIHHLSHSVAELDINMQSQTFKIKLVEKHFSSQMQFGYL